MAIRKRAERGGPPPGSCWPSQVQVRCQHLHSRITAHPSSTVRQPAAGLPGVRQLVPEFSPFSPKAWLTTSEELCPGESSWGRFTSPPKPPAAVSQRHCLPEGIADKQQVTKLGTGIFTVKTEAAHTEAREAAQGPDGSRLKSTRADLDSFPSLLRGRWRWHPLALCGPQLVLDNLDSIQRE